MSQHDMNIENQGFPAFRSDLNNALAALASTSAGATAPSTTFAQQLWYDSTANLLKMRNTDNDAWITLAYFDQTNDEWEVRSAVIQAVDSAGVVIKTDDGTTRIEVQDDGDVSIDSGTLFVDAGNNRVGIGTTSPATKISVKNDSDTDYDPSASAFNSIATLTNGTSGALNNALLAFTTESNGEWYIGGVQNSGNTAADFVFASRASGARAERMRIDSSGNVGIGTASPDFELEVFKAGSCEVAIGTDNAGSAQLSFYEFNSSAKEFFLKYDGLNNYGVIGTSQKLTAMTVHRDNGHFGINTTTPSTSYELTIQSESTGGSLSIEGPATNGYWASEWDMPSGSTYGILFKNGGTGVGNIRINASSTSYNTSSDYRLKENVVDMTDAIDRVKALPVRRFNFIGQTETVDGFIAHEAQEIVPESVSGEKDAMMTEQYVVEPALGEIYVSATEAVLDEEGNVVTDAQDEQIVSSDVEKPETLEDGQQWRETTPAVMGEREVPDYQGIDQAKLVPLLTGALKEAIAKIEALEARVSALES